MRKQSDLKDVEGLKKISLEVEEKDLESVNKVLGIDIRRIKGRRRLLLCQRQYTDKLLSRYRKDDSKFINIQLVHKLILISKDDSQDEAKEEHMKQLSSTIIFNNIMHRMKCKRSKSTCL